MTFDQGVHGEDIEAWMVTNGWALSYGKEDITFRPTHKLVMVGNHKPEIRDTSLGMWRRMLLSHVSLD